MEERRVSGPRGSSASRSKKNSLSQSTWSCREATGPRFLFTLCGPIRYNDSMVCIAPASGISLLSTSRTRAAAREQVPASTVVPTTRAKSRPRFTLRAIDRREPTMRLNRARYYAALRPSLLSGGPADGIEMPGVVSQQDICNRRTIVECGHSGSGATGPTYQHEMKSGRDFDRIGIEESLASPRTDE